MFSLVMESRTRGNRKDPCQGKCKYECRGKCKDPCQGESKEKDECKEKCGYVRLDTFFL